MTSSAFLGRLFCIYVSKMGKQLVLLGIIPFQKNVKKNSLKVSFLDKSLSGFISSNLILHNTIQVFSYIFVLKRILVEQL